MASTSQEGASKGLQLIEETRPDMYQVAEGVDVPADAHEYHTRKNLNDSAFQSLQYKPYVSLMPVPKEVEEGEGVKWFWTKK